MKKIAFINQRYGLEVNGGSELYTRLIAEKLTKEFEVTIITTKAIDYSDWSNFYQKDFETINNVQVIRFPVEKKRSSDFAEYTKFLLSDKLHLTLEQEATWFIKQGPYTPKLIEYIKSHKNHYDVFIFVTYLYYPTINGLKHVASKSIFIPTAHDEPFIHFNTFKELFNLPKAFVFLSDEEKDFVHKTFNNHNIHYDVMGVGVEIPFNVNVNQAKEKYCISQQYIIYAGRIDIAKNIDELFNYFQRYAKKNKNLILILVGKAEIDIPKHPNIRHLGFVSEKDKFDLIAGAKLLVLPSKYESLSIAVLEAFALSVPVLVNEKSEVLKGHVLKSNAGLFYNNFEEFKACLDFFDTHEDIYQTMRKNASFYVNKYYDWNNIIEGLSKIINSI